MKSLFHITYVFHNEPFWKDQQIWAPSIKPVIADLKKVGLELISITYFREVLDSNKCVVVSNSEVYLKFTQSIRKLQVHNLFFL
jgi:hypothetical protein